MNSLEQIVAQAHTDFAFAQDVAALENAKAKYLGKTGQITEQMKSLSSFLNDAYAVTEMPPYGPVGTSNGFRFTAAFKNRIDYVFVSDHFQVRKYAALSDAKDQRYPSDHLPVVATVSFK